MTAPSQSTGKSKAAQSRYFASDGMVATSPLEGGIEISEQEYHDAIEGMLAGKEVRIEEGALVVDFPSEPEPEPEPEPTLEEIIERYQWAIEGHVNAVAQERQYSGAVSCASYVNSTNGQWAAEAAAFIAWRDAVYIYAFAELDKVQNGTREQPTIEAFIAELPDIDWPSGG